MEHDADGDVKIVDAATAAREQSAPPAGTANGVKHEQQELLERDEVVVQDSDVEMGGQEQQQQQGEERAAAATVLTSWQCPIPLDGSVEVTEKQLLDILPSFHSVHAMECQQCCDTLNKAKEDHQGAKQQLEAQKQALSKLLAGSVPENLEPNVPYYLVPK